MTMATALAAGRRGLLFSIEGRRRPSHARPEMHMMALWLQRTFSCGSHAASIKQLGPPQLEKDSDHAHDETHAQLHG